MNNNTCFDCIHLATCYKIEHFGRDLETNIPCKEFIGVSDRIEVVRCKDCKYAKHWYGNNKLGNETFLCYFLAEEGIKMFADNFCSYGERKESYNGKD